MCGCMCLILISLSNQEYRPLPSLSYLSMVVYLRWLYQHMLSVSYISRESWCCVSLSLCSLVICANNRVCYGPIIVSVSLHIALPHYLHYADVSESIEVLKCLVHSVECVSKIKSILSTNSLRMLVRTRMIYVSIIIKSEVWTICYCIGLGHEEMVCAVCISMFV